MVCTQLFTSILKTSKFSNAQPKRTENYHCPLSKIKIKKRGGKKRKEIGRKEGKEIHISHYYFLLGDYTFLKPPPPHPQFTQSFFMITISGGHKSHKNLLAHSENELRIKSTGVRHSYRLVSVVIWLIYRSREAMGPVSRALVSFPKRNVFSYTMSNCLHLTTPQSYKFPCCTVLLNPLYWLYISGAFLKVCILLHAQ